MPRKPRIEYEGAIYHIMSRNRVSLSKSSKSCSSRPKNTPSPKVLCVLRDFVVKNDYS